MAFLSASSKARTKSTVNKLFENVLPNSSIVAAPKDALSSTEVISKRVNKKHLTKKEISKINKADRAKRNKQIKKKLENDKNFQKMVKYNVIKNHKNGSSGLLLEEQKYLKKLIKKNSMAVRRNAEAEDTDVQEEIDSLRDEILQMINEKHDKARDRKQDAKLQSFNEKIKSGTLSYPGLTPGLAPVGLDDDSDESEDESD